MPNGKPVEVSEYAKKVLEEKGIEIPELKKPVTVPPVEIPELYPGFGKEMAQLGVEQYQAQTRLIEAEKAMVGLERRWRFTSPFGMPRPGERAYPVLPFIGVGVIGEEYQQQLELAKQEFDLAMQDFKAAEWRRQVMVTMPNYLSIPDYKLQKPEDILQYIPLDSMRDEDTIWLTTIFDRLKHLSNVLPEGFDGDAIEAQNKVLDEILTSPKLELRAVHNLTVEEIAKSFAFGVAELPQGMTEEDVRSILSQMDLQDEEMKSAKDWLADRAKDWAVESDRLNLIRAGTIQAEAPSLTPLEFGKLLVTQPMMATVELLDKYFSMLPRPLAAAAIVGAHRLFKTPEDVAAAGLEENYDFYRSVGETSWSAYAKAFNDWDVPWYGKLGAEIAFDPVSYIGLGMATAVGYKVGTGLTKAGIRGLGTRIGPWVQAVESGYIAGADAIFKVGVKGILSPIKGAFWLTGAGYQIPRTFTMMARNFARDGYMKFSSALQRTFPEVRNLKGLTAKDAIDAGNSAIDQAIARPMEGWDAAVRAGSPMLEFGYIDEAAAIKLTKEVAEELTFDTNRLSRLNNEVLNMFSGQGERITAGKMIADLGQEATEEMVEKLSTKLNAFKQKVVNDAKAALKGDSATDVLMNNFNRLESIRYANLQSPLTKYMNQAGRSASWHSRVADRVLYSSALVALERRLVMPIARWNLLFANFGPFNFLENMQRSFLGGAEVLYPKAYSGVAETNRLFKGLANAPYELQLFEKGELRLAQAMVDPKTGRAAIFRGGKIPFITREAVIPEKVPFLGGKTIGAKINIAGRDHSLASFQDGYDMWAHFNSMQTAYDYQVHYMKALADIAPDDMGRLTGVLSKHKAALDDIAAIHPSDARDIERALLQDATVGPDAIRAHSKLDVLEFERRQISKDLGKTFDKCTDVRMTTKKGIRDDVLDGSIFDDIDGKMAAFVEQERELSLVSLKNQINVLKDEADTITRIYTGKASLLDDLGRDMSLGEAKAIGLPEVGFKQSPLMLEGRQVGSFQFRAGATPDELVFDVLEVTETGLVNRQFMRDTELLLHNLANEQGASKVTIVAKEQHKLLYEGAGYTKTPLGYTKEVMKPPPAPTNINDFLGDMQNITSMVEGTGERIHDYRKLTELRKAKLLPGEMDDFEVGSAKLLAEFMETAEADLTRTMNQIVEHARAVPVVRFPTSGTAAMTSWKLDKNRLARLYLSDVEGKVDQGLLRETSEDLVRKIEFSAPRLPGGKQLLDMDGFKNLKALVDSNKTIKMVDFDSVIADIHNVIPAAGVELRTQDELVEGGMGTFAALFEGKEALIKSWVKELTPVLNEAQLARLTDLDSVTRLEMENMLATRNKIAEIESIIPRTAKKARNDRFWTQQRAQKATIWEEFDVNARKFKSLRLRASRNFLGSVDKTVFTPDYIPEVVKELTPNHLAYLFGVTGDDLYRGLTRVQHHVTIRPREDFILHAAEQADAYAAKLGKSAADIGFTDDAIGEVYDQLWHNLGVEPTILTPDSPTVMQLEEIRQEVTRLHAANKLPGDPLMYHGTTTEAAEMISKKGFKISDSGILGDGVYLTSAKEEAAVYGEEVLSTMLTTKNVYRVDVTNPKSLRKFLVDIDESPSLGIDDIGDWITDAGDRIKAKGYDAFEMTADFSKIRSQVKVRPGEKLTINDLVEEVTSTLGTPNQMVVFNPKMIKVAKGTYPDVVKWRQYVNSVADDVEKLPMYREAAGTTKWFATKESAVTKSRDMHALAYPTYDDANIIDESMRALFPFWNYEMFRWRWIPRTAMRTPGVMTGIAKYVENTDQGYLPVPGTDLQMNMLRGSVWMGGLRSFYLRDFPEYYDAMPGMEFIDYIARAGFFPGIHVMLPIVAFGAWVEGKPEWGQLAPAWVRTGLSGLRTLSPEHIGAVLEHIYPDRFRDYMTMLTLGEEGYDADEIWRKKQTGEKLTPEEEKLWLKAVARVDGVKGILMQQTGLFRIRPQEFTEIRREMRLAIEEATGVPVSVQDQIDRQYPVTGKRFSDYYKLDVYQQKLLYEWETYRRWQGVTTPLYPSSWQLLDVKTRDYYEELDKVYNEARTVGVYEDDKLIRPSMVEINRQFVEGEIGPDQWMSFRSDMVGSLSEAVRILGESPAYKDVPKTLEERAKMLEERNIPTPTQTPDQELLYYYYELQPEYKWNWESQRMERDFDTYYAYIDILLESLDAPHRERLLQRIQADWTPMEKLYWQTSREYMRPYRNLRTIVLDTYDPEQIQQIRRFEVAPAAEREQLQEIIGPDGDKLISGYQRKLREARQRLRILDPEMDAWLNFFGTTTSLLTTGAKDKYEELRKTYLVPGMVK